MKISQVVRQISRLSFKAGDSLKLTRIITQQDLDKFSDLTGDHNPIHKKSENQKSLVHGAFLNSIVAGVIGTKLPGPGTIVVSQSFTFPSKCFVDDPIDIIVELLDVRKIIKVKYECSQSERIVFEGEAKLVMNKI